MARAFAGYEITSHHRLGEEIAQQIPADAAVSAQANLNPHVSGRRTLYRFPYIGVADYVFVDVSSLSNEGRHYQLVRDLLTGNEFGLVRAEDGYLLFSRGAPPRQALPDEFYSFLRPALAPPAGSVRPQPQYPMSIEFGNGLELVGFDVHDGRRTEMPQTPLEFVLYWQASEPITEDYRIGLYLLDDERQVIGGLNLDEEPGVLYWYPMSRWKVGETIRVPISDMPWWTAQFSRYSVAVGVLCGDDPWDVNARLKPEVHTTSVVAPLSGDETLVELMRFRTDAGGMPRAIERRPSFQPPQHMVHQDVLWDNGLRLLGYRVFRQDVRPGDEINVVLYWETQRPIDLDYTVFVHVMGADGLVGQHDAPPDLNGFPTSRWQPGEVIQDRHPIRLSPDTPPGTYTLEIGLYDPTTGVRVPLAQGGDVVQLASGVVVG